MLSLLTANIPVGRLLILCCIVACEVSSFAEDNWPRFRGESGSGVSSQSGIPVTWTDSEYAWKVTLPEVGHSSPVVWGKSLFVTTATEGGSDRFLYCLNADTGAQQWKVSIKLDESKKHLKNSWASSTPVTDGERIICLFADGTKQQAWAWNFEGQELWHKDLGSYESEHGLGVSPILSDGLLIIPNDQVGNSSIIALNASSGETAWIVERTPGKTSYSTPLVVPGEGNKKQLICISEASGVTSFDLLSGKLNWQTPKLPMRTVASPIVADGLVFATCGEGGNGKYFAAIQTDPSVPSDRRIVYERKTMLPYVPCLVAREGLLFLWGDKGIMVCLDAQTGKEVWSERIDGAFSGSPICIEDRLYCVTEDGVVVVLKAGPEFKELGRTKLGDDCHSTPAVANGHLYIHTFHQVMAIKAR
ncbi:MAG: PQQ-binding-like beta-propeller repeat protein [Planctomycetaceae bacterium]|nr:PQQ-binding-like beta-propeller repeat protein [Planctomycetaceae bacterium]